MNNLKKALLTVFMVSLVSGTGYASKWKELVFTDDVNMGLAELSQYCTLHDISVSDVLWANSIDSGDIKPGQSVYLPVNQADMLAIWQHKGAWQPTALVPVTSAAAAKRAAKPEAQPEPEPEPEVKAEAKPEVPVKSEAEIMAQLRAEVASTPATEPAKPEPEVASTPAPETVQAPAQARTIIPEVKAEPINVPARKKSAELAQVSVDIMAMLRAKVRNSPAAPAPAPVAQVKPAQVPTPAQPPVVAQKPAAKKKSASAKPDRVLAASTPKKAKTEQGGIMDPIIILSPNGDPSKGPMRLVISGDKVEVVQLPQNAAPRRPSMSDLDYALGAGPGYLPHYNLTPKPRDPFILNMGNLAGKMLWPVDGKVSSPFGRWRGNHKHQGIDIPMPAGTPIRAARNGVVTRTGNNSTMGFRGYGNFVLMDHGNGLQTFYAHCLSVAVVQGQRVMQGQVIAYVGNTGRSTANHLHFEVRINSTKVDPIPYLAGNAHLAKHK